MQIEPPSGEEPREPTTAQPPEAPPPARRRLLKSYQLAFLLAVATLVLLLIYPTRGSIRLAEWVFWPLIALAPRLPVPLGNHSFQVVTMLVLGLAYLFGLWFLIVWGLRRSSRGFKLALAVYAGACIGTWWGLKAYRERMDWTERGLNPALPGLKPSVVLLAGTFDYQFTGMDTGWHYTGSARFEIRMRGADYYYAERWTGSYWKYNSWDNLKLLTPEAGWNCTRSYSGSGHHGRGGGMSGNELLVARRLWRGNEFVGATAPDEVRAGQASERFAELKTYGRFKIPMRMEFTEGDTREVLHVRRVEFLSRPSTNWFHAINEKYFGSFSSRTNLWRTNLNEAGWSGQQSR